MKKFLQPERLKLDSKSENIDKDFPHWKKIDSFMEAVS